MIVGDSATISMNIDTLPQKPPGFENASVMLYDIAVSASYDGRGVQTKQKEERAVATDTVLQSLIDEYQPGLQRELGDWIRVRIPDPGRRNRRSRSGQQD